MKKQKVKLNAKLSFDKDIVSILNKDGLSQIIGGMVPATVTCANICMIVTQECTLKCTMECNLQY
jgi:hypothetical protein